MSKRKIHLRYLTDYNNLRTHSYDGHNELGMYYKLKRFHDNEPSFLHNLDIPSLGVIYSKNLIDRTTMMTGCIYYPNYVDNNGMMIYIGVGKFYYK